MKASNWISIWLLSWLFCPGCFNDGVDTTEGSGAIQGGPVSRLITNPRGAANPSDTASLPRMTFSNETFDFGTVVEGEIVTHTFKFTNTGKQPLIIRQATSSCGCTIPEWPKEPVGPGEESEIRAEFNTLRKTGKQRKAITIYSNSLAQQKLLYLTGNVTKKQDNS